MYVPHDRKQNAAREGRDTARNDADDDKELRAELENGCSAHFESRGDSKGVVLRGFASTNERRARGLRFGSRARSRVVPPGVRRCEKTEVEP